MTASKGVQPLVCVVCERIVGVINAGALAVMLDSGEAYICHHCAEIEYPGIEVFLAVQSPDYYAHLVSRAMFSAASEVIDGTAQ